MSDPLVPIAISSEFDTLGRERIHAVSYFATVKYPWTSNALSITGDMPDGLAGTPVNYQYTVSGGTSPYTVSVTSGTVPTGVTIDSQGLATGNYTMSGVFTFRLTVVDSVSSEAYVDDTVLVGVPTILSGHYLYTGTYDNLTALANNSFTLEDSNSVAGRTPSSTSADGITIAYSKTEDGTGNAWYVARFDFTTATYADVTVNGKVQITDGAGFFTAVSDDGTWVVIARVALGNTYFYKWNGTSYDYKSVYDLSSAINNRSLTFLPDSSSFAIGDSDGYVRLYTINSDGTLTLLHYVNTGLNDITGLDWRGGYVVCGVASGAVRLYTDTLTLVTNLSTATDGTYTYLNNDATRIISANTATITIRDLTGAPLNSYSIGFTANKMTMSADRNYILCTNGTTNVLYQVVGDTLVTVGSLPNSATESLFTNFLQT